MMPEATDVRVFLAQLYAGQGEYDRALSLVNFLVGDPHNGARGRELVSDIEALRDAAIGGGQSDPAESEDVPA